MCVCVCFCVCVCVCVCSWINCRPQQYILLAHLFIADVSVFVFKIERVSVCVCVKEREFWMATFLSWNIPGWLPSLNPLISPPPSLSLPPFSDYFISGINITNITLSFYLSLAISILSCALHKNSIHIHVYNRMKRRKENVLKHRVQEYLRLAQDCFTYFFLESIVQ